MIREDIRLCYRIVNPNTYYEVDGLWEQVLGLYIPETSINILDGVVTYLITSNEDLAWDIHGTEVNPYFESRPGTILELPGTRGVRFIWELSDEDLGIINKYISELLNLNPE